jgi:hypothetical protein
MIARQEYYINTDNKKICEYLDKLITINDYLKTLSLDDIWRIEYQLEYQHTDEYGRRHSKPDIITYRNLLNSTDNIRKINRDFDKVLQEMNEEYKCDQIKPSITERINKEKNDTSLMNMSLNRLIDDILSTAYQENIQI